MPAVEQLELAGGFPPTGRHAWMTAVAAVVDRTGAVSPEDAVARLRSTTYDGITLEPLYAADDAPAPTPGSRVGVVARPWDVRQRVDAAAAPGTAVEELERGATSILLDLLDAPAGDRVDDAVERALDGVLTDVAPVVLDARGRWREAADALVGVLGRRGGATAAGTSLGADPITDAVLAPGGLDLDEHLDAVADRLRRDELRDVGVLTVDASRFHDTGSSDAQQLGAALAVTAGYLRALDDRGVAPADVLARTDLRLAATADQFATIATVRAARRTWARLAEVVGAPPDVVVHAVTARAMMTAYSPWVNALRSTVACFAAGVGGADAVTVLPHDALRGPAGTELGRRLARNTQSILQLESHLAEVADPAGGSWYVERYTDELAGAAWAFFQEIEAAGGIVRAAGAVRERIDEVRRAREADVAARRAPLTGLSEFPDVSEPPPPPAEDTSGTRRWSAGLEALRRRVDAVAATGDRPAVFLATIGEPARFLPRVTFAEHAFGVAGLASVRGPVTTDADEIADAFVASGTPLACLCADDDAYGEHADDIATALRTAGARAVWLAGRHDVARAAGVDHAVGAGDDLRAALADALDVIGVR